MNILVIRFSALGDLVTCDIIFKTLRHFYPNANIVLLTSGIGKGLYSDTDYFDKYIVYDSFFNTLQQLRETKYDLVLNLQCNSLSHMLVLFSKYNKVVNSAANIWQKIIGIKKPVKSVANTIIQTGISKNEVDKYFQLDNSFTISMPLKVENKIDTNKKIVVISTGSSKPWPSKKWGVKNYLDLIKKLINDNFEVVLIGTSLELEDAKYIQNECSDIINYVDKTNLTQLKGILYQAELYIGNDSGPSHIAAAVGTNTVTIFGPTSIKHCTKFMPYNGEHICIKPTDEVKCHPCYKGICPTNLECMQNIKVEYVYTQIKKLLNKGE
jgi:ADP-heptose:LPS heptosyltransferase